MKLQIEGEFTYDADLMHSGTVDGEAKLWFFNDILLSEELTVFSPEIGDEIGTLKIKKLEEING